MKKISDLPRILVIGDYRPDEAQSQSGFSKWLINRMPQEGFNVRLVSAPKRFGGPGKFSKWRGYVDKFVLFPPQLGKLSKNIDLIHISDQSHSMYGRHLSKSWMVTVHDLLPQRAAKGEFPGWEIGPTGQLYQKWIRDSLTKARWVGCVSTATLDEFRRTINSDPSVSYLTLNGLYDEFHKMSDDDSQRSFQEIGFPILSKKPFLFHLGGNLPYKNRPGYIRILSELRKNGPCKDFLYVIAGKPCDAELRQVIAEAGLGDSLIQLDQPSFKVVKSLYSSAAALIFPSIAEGFGLPILEAMKTGCPVFTSNRPPMTEVGGNAARYFDPTDPKAAAIAISEAWIEREIMIKDGYKQAEKFSSDASAREYANLYRRMLDA